MENKSGKQKSWCAPIASAGTNLCGSSPRRAFVQGGCTRLRPISRTSSSLTSTPWRLSSSNGSSFCGWKMARGLKTIVLLMLVIMASTGRCSGRTSCMATFCGALCCGASRKFFTQTHTGSRRGGLGRVWVEFGHPTRTSTLTSATRAMT
jgi:hypothetical protein